MKEGTHLILKDGREILLEDEEDIILSIHSGKTTVHTFPVPYPSGGYGGGTLLLSPSEQYLLFAFYSGESEEAYRLYRILDRSLELSYESGYLCGEGAGYLFSDQEALLIQSLPKSMGPWYMEDADTAEDGTRFFAYGEVHILDIAENISTTHQLHVYPSQNWDEELAESEPFRISSITEHRKLTLQMPWGTESLTLPLNDLLVFRL